jgi:hypothetical protein
MIYFGMYAVIAILLLLFLFFIFIYIHLHIYTVTLLQLSTVYGRQRIGSTVYGLDAQTYYLPGYANIFARKHGGCENYILWNCFQATIFYLFIYLSIYSNQNSYLEKYGHGLREAADIQDKIIFKSKQNTTMTTTYSVIS